MVLKFRTETVINSPYQTRKQSELFCSCKLKFKFFLKFDLNLDILLESELCSASSDMC
jgi:hypothetical protein